MPVSKTKRFILRYQGLYDFDGLYHMIVNFFKSRNYDYIEKKWKEKDMSPIGREIEIKMTPTKKITEYIAYWYKITWANLDVHTVDVVKEGETVKLTHARFAFDMSGHVDSDWQNFAKDNPKLGKFFQEHVFKQELRRTYKKALEVEMQTLLDQMKEFLNMEISRVQKNVV